MQINSEIDRLEFDSRVQARLGDRVGKIFQAQLLRASLGVLRPHELVGIWFRHGSRSVPSACVDQLLHDFSVLAASGAIQSGDQTAVAPTASIEAVREAAVGLLALWIERARGLIACRSVLFAWVYGTSPAIKELVDVRLPSRERRLLIDLVISGLRQRYPWLKNRHVTAMAFRPASFTSLRSIPVGRSQWGPLYRRVVIQKGRKRRCLWIPSRVLKKIQKSLLRVLQPTVDQAIGSHVFGARAGLAAPIFANAAAHMHRTMIASFDISDFFPSTSVADVIRGLQHIGKRHPLAVDPARSGLYPAYLADGIQLQAIEWTDDLRVFIARIGTHRGRVPQGSPLSPMLANIAFSPYDDLLIEMLNQEFGQGRVKYTRYFDDLTISALTPPGAGASMSPADFRRKCDAVITKVVTGSSYKLNSSKSRSSTSAVGHVVTGLMVRKDELNLPRRQRRELRTVLHALKRQDFVKTAYRWRQLAGRPEVKFETIRRGHRFTSGRLTSLRMSAERLTTLMLKRLYPDLKLRRLLPDWHPWQERVESVEDNVAGKKMWPLVEWVLAALWTGVVQADRPTDESGGPVMNRIVIRQGGSEVCSVEAESTLDFFFLTRDRAIATAEYWHHLQGMAAYLNSCPEGESFSRIRNLGKSLQEACAVIEVRATPDEPIVVLKPVVSEPVTTEEAFRQLTTECDVWLQSYLSFNAVSPGPGFGEARDAFRYQRARDWSSMLRWLRSAHALTTGLCPTLPIGPMPEDHKTALELYEYLRWRSAVAEGVASDDYVCVQEFEKKNNIGPATPATELSRVQERIAGLLLAGFKGANQNPISKNTDRIFVNHWHGALRDRLREQLNALEGLHSRAQTDAGERRLFRVGTWAEGGKLRDTVLQPQHQPLVQPQVWPQLEKVGKLIYLLIVEAMEDRVWAASPPEAEPFPEAWRRRQLWKQSQNLLNDPSKILKIVETLRNREAHGTSPERRQEWVAIQSKVARVLGRAWKSKSGPKHEQYSAPDDLVLTPYEGQFIQMEMLLVVNEWLGRIVELQWWRPETNAL
jgi:hypothetical protein